MDLTIRISTDGSVWVTCYISRNQIDIIIIFNIIVSQIGIGCTQIDPCRLQISVDTIQGIKKVG